MKILIVLFRTLGDVVMGTTVVRAVRQKFPEAKIDFVTEKQNVNILEGNLDINEIIVMDNYFDANVLFVKGNYDKIYRLNMANHDDTCWHHIPSQQNQHLVEWYAKRAELETLEDVHHYIYPNENDVKVVESIMSTLPKDLIIVHASSGAHKGGPRVESKDWPVQNFSILSERLIRNGYKVAQIGAFNDKKMSCDNLIDLTGSLTFKQHLLLFEKSKAFIGVDSGPAYLAGESGIPCLIIAGSTQNQSKSCKGPSVGPRHPNVNYINPTRPNHPMCGPVPCYTHCQIGKPGGCVSDITTDFVFETFIKMIKKEQ